VWAWEMTAVTGCDAREEWGSRNWTSRHYCSLSGGEVSAAGKSLCPCPCPVGRIGEEC
jgi:hypothetical protein